MYLFFVKIWYMEFDLPVKSLEYKYKIRHFKGKAQIQHGRTAAASESNTIIYLHSKFWNVFEYIMTFLGKQKKLKGAPLSGHFSVLWIFFYKATATHSQFGLIYLYPQCTCYLKLWEGKSLSLCSNMWPKIYWRIFGEYSQLPKGKMIISSSFIHQCIRRTKAELTKVHKVLDLWNKCETMIFLLEQELRFSSLMTCKHDL